MNVNDLTETQMAAITHLEMLSEFASGSHKPKKDEVTKRVIALSHFIVTGNVVIDDEMAASIAKLREQLSAHRTVPES